MTMIQYQFECEYICESAGITIEQLDEVLRILEKAGYEVTKKAELRRTIQILQARASFKKKKLGCD